MEDLKIRVTTEQESKEAQGLFFDLGCYIDYPKKCLDDAVVLFSESCGLLTYSSTETYTNDGVVYKEITLQELRDMVVLKRNDPKDGTHIDGHYKDIVWFRKSSGGYHKFDEKTNKWSGEYPITYVDACNLIPIKEEVMKEYLFKYNDQYTLVELSKEDAESNPEQYIEVPEGAILAFISQDTGMEGQVVFAKGDDNDVLVKDCRDLDWDQSAWDGMKELLDYGFDIVWQQEKESIIDKLVVDEVKHGVDATLAERQSQYGCFEDVAFVTENIMSILSKVRSNGLQDLPHSHRMALYMIASKMARIVNGDFNHFDSWHDIGGYSKLIENLIGGNNEI